MKKHLDNRDLSLLKFNERVLLQSMDTTIPLGERLHFLAIFSSNLEHFMTVRLPQIHKHLEKCLDSINRLNQLKDEAYYTLINDLKGYGYLICHIDELSDEDLHFLESYYHNSLSSSLITIKDRNELESGVVYVAVKNEDEYFYLSCDEFKKNRLIRLSKGCYVLLEDVISYMSIASNESKAFIRFLRSEHLDYEDIEYSGDMSEGMEELLRRREILSIISVEYRNSLSHDLSECFSFQSDAPLDLSFLELLRDDLRIIHPELFYEEFIQTYTKISCDDVMKRDRLLEYPYDSMESFISLLDDASVDQRVKSIEMTFYRSASHSRIVDILIEASRSGKDVSVVIELRARNDESHNLETTKLLQDAGVKVYFGKPGYKVHSKLCLITFENGSSIAGVGTGNFNEETATLYTDLYLLTSHSDYVKEVQELFCLMKDRKHEYASRYLLVSPYNMQEEIVRKIDEQIQLGKKGYIGIKCNNLTSKKIIRKLIKASHSGVKIDLVIRGACCIVPGIKDCTENIRVISIVGRFLEHSRIYIFGKDVYISSADMMKRNLKKRIEVAIPLTDEKLRQKVLSRFHMQLDDNINAYEMNEERVYKKRERHGNPIDSQR